MAKLLCAADAPEWLELRRTGVTASDLPAIMGLVSWDSPWALYHRKRGLLPEVEQTDRMRLGSWLEDRITGEWWNWHANGEMTMDPGGLYRSDERPWQMTTPDRTLEPSVAVLECKTSATRDGWGEDRSADVPAYVRAQVLWQMDTLDVPTGHVAVVFLPSGEFRSYTIEHDTQTGESHEPGMDGRCLACRDQYAMRAAGLEFYKRITGDLGPPPVDHLTVTTKALQAVYAGLDDTLQAELSPDLAEAWEGSRMLLRAAQRDKGLYDNLVRSELGTAGVGTLHGQPWVRRTISKRAGYEVAPGVQDKLTTIKTREASDG